MKLVDWNVFWPPVRLSVQVAASATAAAVLLGTACSRWMTLRKRKGTAWLETIWMLPLVLPPSATGFLLLVVFGRNSFAGKVLEHIFGSPLVFSPAAAVVAAAVVSFPLVYQATKTGFLAVDRDLEDAARTDGAGEWRVFRYVTLPLSSRSLLAAAILGFCRSLGEFGATLMVAGNIPGKTQTVPTAIYIAVGSGDMKTAWAWTASIVFLSFLLLLLADRLPANRPFSR
ncbi:MAG: molybdenum ABC transporter permease subunit [Candidatus Reconcilbacillus cellulovorans]|uniref:Molybdenum transport system permease n=1 Tax=Candidatus Reconcilbacillus cellulovorans TaxID=1906605 RepID=A0A2A6DX11_9BACL|nr:MAG: molybdenum ABC transporter permease subunit [Candidatus Reconcilbacillus cellulovorans]